MDYRLNLGAWKKIFAVPAAVAEDHLKLASGTQIKVLLYLLAHPDLGLRAENISEAVGTSPENVDDALLYWKNAGILAETNGEMYPSETYETRSAPLPVRQEPKENTLDTPEARAKLSSDIIFPPKEIASAVNGSTAVKYLFDTYERLAGRPPKYSEQRTLMVLTEEVGLPCEVTMMLVEYCFNIDKATPAYMKAVALDWVQNGIDDLPKAEERIRLLQSRTAAEKSLRARLGLSSSFSTKQKQMIAEWADMGISDALIDEAYDITLTNTGKMSFPYMDKILKKWHSEGITDPSQIKKDKKPETASPAKKTSYDLSVIEQQSLDLYKDIT